MRWFLCLALLVVCGVAEAQTRVTVSGFNGTGGGWTTHTQHFNGTWDLSSGVAVKASAHVMQSGPNAPGPTNPPGAMVAVTRTRSGYHVVFHANAAGVYVPVMVFGLGSLPTGTIRPGGFNLNDPRTIVVE